VPERRSAAVAFFMAVGGILLPVVVMKEQRAKGQDLSRWLQEKRRQDGLSLREIARMTDLSHGTVAGILPLNHRPLPARNRL